MTWNSREAWPIALYPVAERRHERRLTSKLLVGERKSLLFCIAATRIGVAANTGAPSYPPGAAAVVWRALGAACPLAN